MPTCCSAPSGERRRLAVASVRAEEREREPCWAVRRRGHNRWRWSTRAKWKGATILYGEKAGSEKRTGGEWRRDGAGQRVVRSSRACVCSVCLRRKRIRGEG